MVRNGRPTRRAPTEPFVRTAPVDVRRFRSAIRILERELARALRGQTACCGVTAAQCHLLLELAAREPLSVSALAGGLGLDKSTLSRTLDGLAGDGLVRRDENPGDRRALGVTLTEKGRRAVQGIDEQCDGEYEALLGLIPAGRRPALLEAVELLGGAMRSAREERAGTASPALRPPQHRRGRGRRAG
jgi:DNA-binding MarR family transcriptional regulator